jgi:hypothetical protein
MSNIDTNTDTASQATIVGTEQKLDKAIRAGAEFRAIKAASESRGMWLSWESYAVEATRDGKRIAIGDGRGVLIKTGGGMTHYRTGALSGWDESLNRAWEEAKQLADRLNKRAARYRLAKLSGDLAPATEITIN